jgi:hypothetical protein
MNPLLFSSRLEVVERRFTLLDATIAPAPARADVIRSAGLLSAVAGSLIVATGVWGGPVEVEIEWREEAGEDPQPIAEAYLRIPSRRLTISSADAVEIELPPASTSDVRIRVAAIGRSSATDDQVVADSAEQYRIELSPGPHRYPRTKAPLGVVLDPEPEASRRLRESSRRHGWDA